MDIINNPVSLRKLNTELKLREVLKYATAKKSFPFVWLHVYGFLAVFQCWCSSLERESEMASHMANKIVLCYVKMPDAEREV